MPTADPAVEAVEAVCRHIREAADRPPSLRQLADAVGLSPGHLQRVFKRLTGVSPKQFADAVRVGRLRAGLKPPATVTDAMLAAGYGSPSRLYERAADHLGMTPGAYRDGGPAERVRFAVGPSDLGLVLVAATDRGVCGVSLGDDPEALEAWVRAEFPSAAVDRAEDELADWLAAVLAAVAGAGPHPDLPLDVRGTAFQRRVWEELRRIPRGQTRTYAQVAAAVGRPKAVRAVAGACAANPAAVVTPCHRVVGSDGKMHGFRWGVDRKLKLLEREKPAAG